VPPAMGVPYASNCGPRHVDACETAGGGGSGGGVYASSSP